MPATVPQQSLEDVHALSGRHWCAFAKTVVTLYGLGP